MPAGSWQVLRRLGWRQLLTRPRRTLLTVLGVAGGVALIFATASIDATLRESIDTAVRGVAGNAQLEVSAPPSSAGLRPELVARIAASEGVASAIPVRRAIARGTSRGESRRLMVIGVPTDLGRLFPDRLGRAGRQIAALRAGDLLLAPDAFGRDAARGRGGALRIDGATGRWRLRALDELASVPFDDLNGGAFALTSVDTPALDPSRRGLVDAVYVTAATGTSVEALRAELDRRVLGRAFVGPPGSPSLPYQRAFSSLSQLTRLAVAGSIWVALLVVFNSLSMSLMERRRPIALAFALGATRGQVATALLGEAVLLGGAGALLGVGGGYLLGSALLDRSLDAYPLLPLTDSGRLLVDRAILAVAAVSGPALAALGALVPIWRILDAAPIEALRAEPTYEWRRQKEISLRSRMSIAGVACAVLGVAAAVLATRADMPWWTAGLAMVALLTGGLILLPAALTGPTRSVTRTLRGCFGVIGGLAGDSLARNPARTAVTVGVLALTTATAIGLGGALGSFESEMGRAFTERYGAPVFVTAASYSGITSDQPLPARVAATLREVEGVRAVYPLRYRPANIEGDHALIASAPLIAQERDGLRTALATTDAASRAALIAGLRRGGVVPSRLTAERHDLRIGQRIRIPAPRGEARLPVVGVFDDVLSVDSVYMERRTYRRLSGDSTVDHFAIAPTAGTPTAVLEGRLERVLRSDGIDAKVQGRAAVIDDILANVRGMFSIARGLQLAALLIAGLVIANTLLTVVSERRWELSLGRTLGMTAAQVRGAVLLEALAVAVLGLTLAVIAGIGIGALMLASMEARFAWAVPYEPQWLAVATVVVGGIGVVVLAALAPAHMAARGELGASLRAE